MDAFGEVICDICHKQSMKKSNLNRHVKTIHEKIEDFTCMKCQKNYKEKHHLKRHQQKCGKCKKCEIQFDLLTDFVKHTCKRKRENAN